MGLEERHRGQCRDNMEVGKKACCLGDGELGHCFQPGCSSAESGPWTYFIWPEFCFFFFFK